MPRSVGTWNLGETGHTSRDLTRSGILSDRELQRCNILDIAHRYLLLAFLLTPYARLLALSLGVLAALTDLTRRIRAVINSYCDLCRLAYKVHPQRHMKREFDA
jgi:hypothetical protein